MLTILFCFWKWNSPRRSLVTLAPVISNRLVSPSSSAVCRILAYLNKKASSNHAASLGQLSLCTVLGYFPQCQLGPWEAGCWTFSTCLVQRIFWRQDSEFCRNINPGSVLGHTSVLLPSLFSAFLSDHRNPGQFIMHACSSLHYLPPGSCQGSSSRQKSGTERLPVSWLPVVGVVVGVGERCLLQWVPAWMADSAAPALCLCHHSVNYAWQGRENNSTSWFVFPCLSSGGKGKCLKIRGERASEVVVNQLVGGEDWLGAGQVASAEIVNGAELHSRILDQAG